MLRTVALVMALMALTLPAVASAASWGPMQRISQAVGSVESPALAFDSRGDGLVMWRQLGQPTGSPPREAAQVTYAWRHPDGTFDLPKTIGDKTFPGGLAMSAGGRALLFTGRRVGTRTEQLEAYAGTPGHTLRRIQVIDRSRRPYFTTPVLAADSRGDAVALWTNGVGPPRRVAYFAVRSHGGPFSAPRRVSASGAHTLAAAMAPSGRFVIAWLRAGRVEARFGSGLRLSEVGRAGRLSKVLRVLSLTTAIDSAGDSLIAWSASAGLFTAYRPAGAPLRRARKIAPGFTDNMRLAFVGRGHAVLVWTNGRALTEKDFVRGVPSSARQLSPPLGTSELVELDALATGPGGQAATAWTSDQLGSRPGRGQLFVSYRPPGSPFGPPEQVNDPSDDALFSTALAFDDDSIVAVWSANSVPSVPASPDFAESATRR